MNLRSKDRVSAVALVVESANGNGAENGADPADKEVEATLKLEPPEAAPKPKKLSAATGETKPEKPAKAKAKKAAAKKKPRKK